MDELRSTLSDTRTEALSLTRQISLPSEGPVTTLEIPEVIAASVPHKNKYGEDYQHSQGYEAK